MITVTPDNNCLRYYGLSTDGKPTGFQCGDKIIPIGNGSEFIEQDTGKVYLYDQENKK